MFSAGQIVYTVSGALNGCLEAVYLKTQVKTNLYLDSTNFYWNDDELLDESDALNTAIQTCQTQISLIEAAIAQYNQAAAALIPQPNTFALSQYYGLSYYRWDAFFPGFLPLLTGVTYIIPPLMPSLECLEAALALWTQKLAMLN